MKEDVRFARAIVDKAIPTATREELIDLLREVAQQADNKLAGIVDCYDMMKSLVARGQAAETKLKTLHRLVGETRKHMDRACALSPIGELEVRESLFKAVAQCLREMEETHVPSTSWPDVTAIPTLQNFISRRDEVTSDGQ